MYDWELGWLSFRYSECTFVPSEHAFLFIVGHQCAAMCVYSLKSALTARARAAALELACKLYDWVCLPAWSQNITSNASLRVDWLLQSLAIWLMGVAEKLIGLPTLNRVINHILRAFIGSDSYNTWCVQRVQCICYMSLTRIIHSFRGRTCGDVRAEFT